MANDIIDPRTGKPRRHDGRDPWSFMTREEALAATDELGLHVPPLPSEAPPPVSPGGFVLLVVVRERPDPQGRHEAVWVEVTGADDDGFTGVLDNQPTWVRGLASGDTVRFQQRHVMRFKA